MISFKKVECLHKTILRHLLKSRPVGRQLSQTRLSTTSTTKDSNRFLDEQSNHFIDQYLDKERDFAKLSVDSFKQLVDNDETKARIESILSEYEYHKYATLRVPKTLTVDNMSDLLLATTNIERIKMFEHFLRKEINKINNKIEQKLNSETFLAQKKEKFSLIGGQKTGLFDSDGNLMYGLWHNSLLTKLYPKHVKRLYANRLRIAALYGQKLILDLDYDQYMSFSDCHNLARQIKLVIGINRYKRKEPFDIHFTNCNINGQCVKSIQKLLDNWDSPTFMTQFHTKSYTDLYPTHNLVYLSPMAEKKLDYNFDDIYIIGGFSKLYSKEDRYEIEKRSYLKANKEGLRTARIPIDEHLVWKKGSKSLDISCVAAILYEVRMSGDWSKALTQNISPFSQKTAEEIAYEDSIRLKEFQKSVRLKNVKKLIKQQ